MLSLIIFLLKKRHRSTTCIVILYITIQPLYAGENLLLSKKLPDQKEGVFYLAGTTYNENLPKGFNLSLPGKVQPSIYTNVTKEGNFSFGSALKGLAYALCKGTRYAVNHPRQLLALGLATHFIPIAAQTGSDFLINQNTTNRQQYPSVASSANGNVFVVWDSNQADDYDIYGRVFFPNGTAPGSDFIINQITTNNQEFPSVTGLINGNVFVAWADYRTSISDPDIYGRIFSPNGTAMGSDFIINEITTNEQFYPSVTGLINGNVFVAWIDVRSGSYDIYGRVFFPNGTALGSEFIINQITTFDQGFPSVSGLTNGNVFVAWRDNRVSAPDIYGRVFFPDGTALGSEFIINQITGIGTNFPSVSGLINGNVFVAWIDYRTAVSIYGMVFFPNGTALGSEFIINQITANTQRFPSVSCLTNGNAFVAWSDNRVGAPEIYGRVFFPNGTALGSDFIINQITTDDQVLPSVTGLTNGNVFVAWEDHRAGTPDPDIYGRIFSDLDLAGQNSIPFSSLPSSTPSPSPSATPVSLSITPTQSTEGTGIMTTPSSQIASTNPASLPSSTPNPSANQVSLSITPTQSTGGTGSMTTPTSQIVSTNSLFMPTSSLVSTNPSPTVPPSEPLERSDSSTGFSNGASWQTPTAIAGGVGAAALIGSIGAVVAKKHCCSKRKKSGKDVELVKENGKTPKNIETPTSSSSSQVVSPFEVKSEGFTEHPAFVGAIHGHTYEIWKKISKEEAELLRPLTSMTIPETAASKKIKFTLGRGHFGATYAGGNPQTDEIYAIKEVYGKKAVDESLREGEIVHSLGDYPHIMPLIDYIHFASSKKGQEPRLLQVMPLAYINGIGFKKLLERSRNDLRGKIVSDSFLQMMMGLDYIHSKGVVHLDIKADNTLYMKDGILRIADFGRAKQVGENDLITNIYILGDMRKFSPEILAFIRKCLGGTSETVESFSGKSTDVWAAGLYIWELLEDNTDNLFSIERDIPLKTRASIYTYEHLEELVENINSLKGKYSSTLLNLLRQALTVDAEIRIKASQVIKKLSTSTISNDERNSVFEELIKLATEYSENVTDEERTTPAQVYTHTDPTLYPKKTQDKQQSPAYVPSDFYFKQTTNYTAAKKQKTSVGNMSGEPTKQIKKAKNKQSPVYIPSDLYGKE